MSELYEYKKYPSLANTEFRKMARRKAELKEKIEAMQKEVDGLNQSLGVYLMKANAKSVLFEGWKLSLVESEGRRTLSKELLLVNGVDAETIEASMKKGDPYVTVSITKVKEEKADGKAEGAVA